MALYAQDLFTLACSKPNCKHEQEKVILGSRCHPDVPTLSFYRFDTNTLLITCAKCSLTVAEIVVAAKPKEKHTKTNVFVRLPQKARRPRKR